MELDKYRALTDKSPIKTKPRTRPLPKAKEKYLEAEEKLFQELEEHSIGYERKFQFKSTKNWRFDFYIVRLRLLIEIAGTAEGVDSAYQKMMQTVAASGDVGVIAAANTAGANRDLRIEVDATGKASVKSMDELTSANDRVRNSAERIGDGYRHAGNIAREEAKSVKSEWEQAIDAAQASTDKFRAEMKRQGESLSKGIYDYSSYSKADVLSQLKSKGYSDKEAEKLAGSIWSEAMAADRSAKEQGLGKDGSLAVKALINAEFNNAASKGLTTQHGTNKINDLLNQMTASNLVSTGPSAKAVDVNSLAPNVSTPTPVTTTTDVSKTVKYEFNSGGKAVTLYGSPNDGDAMEALLSEFEMLKKGT